MLWNYVMSLTGIYMTLIRKSGKRLIGALGAKGGALAGAAIGTAILPGLGTAVGGIAGGLILGVAGSSLGKWVIDITDVGEQLWFSGNEKKELTGCLTNCA